RFFRSMDGEQDTFSGLGLGLYIASRIVDNHGGKIWVKSKVGKGSTFYFKIPIIKE
ncbi:HAMP domain-containing histidine kinase, partial [Candidatus Daviesbacteria bacterium]|nr:HAMP domain-containing histidine kinase [Candidatus Daviesbacteria bacterium]